MKYTSKKPFEKGYNEMISAVEHPEMMGLEYGVVAMESGDVMNFDYAQEVVYDLMMGQVTFTWDGNMETVERKDCFHEGAILLHVPENTKVTITCQSEKAEIAVCRTENKKKFAARLLRAQDCLCANEERGAGQMNECSTRMVRTFLTALTVRRPISLSGKWFISLENGHPIRLISMLSRRCIIINSFRKTVMGLRNTVTMHTK